MTRTLITTILLLLSLPGVAGDVYKWQDEEGHWHYSDKPPAQDESFSTVEVPGESRSMLTMRQGGTDRSPEHFFFNHYAGPAQVEISLKEAHNVRSNPDLPARFVLPPQTETRLLSIQGINPQAGFSYRLVYTLIPGPPMENLPRDLDFNPPFARGLRFPISQGLDDSNTHSDPENRYAVDIAMPMGTPVLAARSGLVIDFEDDYHGEGKQQKRYMRRANHIRILHDDGSMAVYAHLEANSARVRPGMRVNAGRWIGNSGNSGYSSGPHLHFVIQFNAGMSLESLPFRFKLPNGSIMDPDRPQMLSGVLPAPTP